MNPKGIVVINKEVGLSSFQVVSGLRKLLHIKKLGHCGTLDPFATGVLPVAVGRATSAIQFMEPYTKTYRSLAVLGEARDTQDIEGESIARFPGVELARLFQQGLLTTKLSSLELKFSGELLQTPPMYSAVKYHGQPLYKYARAGQEVERKSRPVHVHIREMEILKRRDLEEFLAQRDFILPREVPEEAAYFLYSDLEVSKGTYIRTWIHDIGEALGVHAYCLALERSRCGPYELDQGAWRLSDLQSLSQELQLKPTDLVTYLREQQILQDLATVFAGYPELALEQAEALELIQGKQPLLPERYTGRREGLIYCSYQETALAVVEVFSRQGNYYLKSRRVFASHADI